MMMDQKSTFKFQDLKRINEAPKHGHMLAYTRRRVIFHPYTDLSFLDKELEEEELLEIHLFDSDKEYRAIKTRSPRYTGGIIEAVALFEETEGMIVNSEQEAESVYRLDTVTEKNMGILTVLHHISYDENNGMAKIDNYRLKMGE